MLSVIPAMLQGRFDKAMDQAFELKGLRSFVLSGSEPYIVVAAIQRGQLANLICSKPFRDLPP